MAQTFNGKTLELLIRVWSRRLAGQCKNKLNNAWKNPIIFHLLSFNPVLKALWTIWRPQEPMLRRVRLSPFRKTLWTLKLTIGPSIDRWTTFFKLASIGFPFIACNKSSLVLCKNTDLKYLKLTWFSSGFQNLTGPTDALYSDFHQISEQQKQ